MVVAPQITELTTETVEVGPGVNAPIINQRTATTSVSVQSGQSILIGGLISTSDELTSKRMPLLGDIPVVGALFRSNVKPAPAPNCLSSSPSGSHQWRGPGHHQLFHRGHPRAIG